MLVSIQGLGLATQSLRLSSRTFKEQTEPESNVFTRSPFCPAAPAWPSDPFWPFSPKGP